MSQNCNLNSQLNETVLTFLFLLRKYKTTFQQIVIKMVMLKTVMSMVTETCVFLLKI